MVSREASRHRGLSALLLVLALTVGLPAGGAARGGTLAEIVAFWEQHVAGAFRCTLPAAQPHYAAQEAFARAVFEELKQNPGLECGSPAA